MKQGYKSFSWGVATGAVAMFVAAFATGWATTDSTRDAQVEAASIDGQAQVCNALARSHRLTTGDEADLRGYQARSERDTLARSFTIVRAGQNEPDPRVVRACSDLLNS